MKKLNLILSLEFEFWEEDIIEHLHSLWGEITKECDDSRAFHSISDILLRISLNNLESTYLTTLKEIKESKI